MGQKLLSLKPSFSCIERKKTMGRPICFMDGQTEKKTVVSAQKARLPIGIMPSMPDGQSTCGLISSGSKNIKFEAGPKGKAMVSLELIKSKGQLLWEH